MCVGLLVELSVVDVAGIELLGDMDAGAVCEWQLLRILGRLCIVYGSVIEPLIGRL